MLGAVWVVPVFEKMQGMRKRRCGVILFQFSVNPVDRRLVGEDHLSSVVARASDIFGEVIMEVLLGADPAVDDGRAELAPREDDSIGDGLHELHVRFDRVRRCISRGLFHSFGFVDLELNVFRDGLDITKSV